jgi:hypothetical protein
MIPQPKTRTEFLDAVYLSLKNRKGATDKVSLAAFSKEVYQRAFAWQHDHAFDVADYWGKRALSKVPAWKLASLYSYLWGELARHDIYWGVAEDEDLHEQAALAIGAVRWINQYNAGRIAYPDYSFTDGELSQYLQSKDTYQMAMNL